MTAILGPAPCQGCGYLVWWHGATWADEAGDRHVCAGVPMRVEACVECRGRIAAPRHDDDAIASAVHRHAMSYEHLAVVLGGAA